MLQLISLNDRQELVVSTDTALLLEKEDREPVRFIDLDAAKLNGEEPSIFKIRPLNSHETMLIMADTDSNHATTVIKAVELGLVSVLGPAQPGIPASTPDAVRALALTLPAPMLAALGTHILAKSLNDQDPPEPDASAS